MKIEDVVTILREAIRYGAVADKPEGERFIVISDTLANQMVLALEAEFDSPGEGETEGGLKNEGKGEPVHKMRG